MEQTEKIMHFVKECEKLKSTYRYTITSWSRNESTAEHTRRLAVMVLLLWNDIKDKIDVFHALKLALFHDLAEALVGDIDAYEIEKNPHLKKIKAKNEKKAMKYFENILWWKLGSEVFSYREEYEKWASEEAKFVKALDKLETLNQFIDAWKNIFEDGSQDFLATYADNHVSDFPALKKALLISKKNLKKMYKKWWFEWKTQYDSWMNKI